jgi:hypothetical protein
MRFPDAGGANKNDVGVSVEEVQFEKMFNLHAVELGWPVPIPSSHSFDDGETGLMDSALDAAVMAQRHFTGDKFLEVVEMAVTVASCLFGGRHGVFEQIDQTKAP